MRRLAWFASIVAVVAVLLVGAVALGGRADDDDDDDEGLSSGQTSTCTAPMVSTSLPASTGATDPVDDDGAAPSTSTSTSTGTTGDASATSSAASTTVTTQAPPSVEPAVVVRHGSASGARVALTFDAGSDAGSTSRILELLAERGYHASFGLTGCWVEDHPDMARQIVNGGHAVINHTQDHLSFTGLSTGSSPISAADRISQLRDAETLIRNTTGADPRPWFRPPYGDYDQSVLVDVASAGYGYAVMWSVDSLGWTGLAPADVTARTIAALEPGAIVLLHVGSASTDVDALPAILDAIEERGLQPVTIPQLLA
jgi:peptidoglycan/xylan/chitin deacetylase (PgdA/CDA1 family)